MSDENGAVPTMNWKDAIASNIHFFRDQVKQLDDVYNPSQVASGALMTVMIMNHNMVMAQIAIIHGRLERIEQLLSAPSGESGPPHRD
jgi:hypothetical protein